MHSITVPTCLHLSLPGSCLVAKSCLSLCNPMDHQDFLSFTISWSSLKFMSVGSVMPSNHLILCHPLLLLLSVFPSIRGYLMLLQNWVPNSHIFSDVARWTAGPQKKKIERKKKKRKKEQRGKDFAISLLVSLANRDKKLLAIMSKPLLQSQFASGVTAALQELDLYSREVITCWRHVVEGSSVLASLGCPQSSVIAGNGVNIINLMWFW